MHTQKATAGLVSVIFYLLAFFSAPALPLYAQPPEVTPPVRPGATPQPAPAAPPRSPEAPETPLPAGDRPVIKKGEVSFNFDDADIYEVIQTVFGDILKVNYLIDPKVKGRVNFRTVTPIPRKDVLPIMEVLLKLNGAGFVEDKGIYKILPLNEIPGTTPNVFVYPLQNSKAGHIASLLQSIFTGAILPPGQAQARPGVQAGIPPAQRQGSSTLASGTGFLVSPETRVLADEITNSLIVLATPADYSFVEETVKKLDTVPRQVMIEVLIAEITLQDQLKFGLEWLISSQTNLQMNPFKRDIHLNGFIGQNTDTLATTDLTKGLSGFSYAAVDAAGKVKALLNTLASESKLNVLASPHIIAADNREARIQIGDQVPIATSQATAVGTSNSILTTIQYKDTGTILKVKPQINESGLVSMEVSQEVSNFTPQTVLGTDQFIFSKREASTNVVAQDGQTIVIGGLISNNDNRTRSGIPLLSKLPIIGYLFGSTSNSKTKTEIIVMLTPHVMRNQQEAGTVSSAYIDRLKGVDIREYIETNKLNFGAPGSPGTVKPQRK